MLCNWQSPNKQLPLAQRGEWSKITGNVYKNIKKHQIIFVRRRFARDKTQSTQELSTPFDWKCRTNYSSSLILKITICSAFIKKTAQGIVLIFIKKLQELV